VRGVWIPQALFNVRVADTDAASYVNRSVSAVLATDEEEKKCKYSSAAELRHTFFTPFVVLVDGALGHEALLKDCLYSGWGKSYGHVLMWIRVHVHLAFAVIRATNLCLRGSHVCWQSGTSIDDGAGLLNVTLDHK